MEATIAVLPPEVIDQIAAGEVIERPASVVKELVDNAIDAGARTIAVEVESGGRALIRVVDDGRGMSPGDALLAFERHATSKLRGFDDLWALSTLGFRGEALPAIASVSRLTLTTRRASALAATRIVMEAGRRGPITEVGAPVGTTVEVEGLLRNVPARLKFLKSDATEASHTTELVAKIAMAYPELHVKLRHNGRMALDVPPDRDVFARAQALMGPRAAARLLPASGEETGVRVRCVLGAPELAQTTARGVQLFVGRRPVRDRGLLHALAVGYGELVVRGRYPVAVVLIDPPDGTVDVNVHPQKAEVRFSDPSAVYAAVRHVVKAAIARAPWREEIGAGPGVMTALPSVAPPRLPFDPALPESAGHRDAVDGGIAPGRVDERAQRWSDGAHPRRAVSADVRATAASHVYAAQLRQARGGAGFPVGAPAQLALHNDAWSASQAAAQRDAGVATASESFRRNSPWDTSAARSWAHEIKQRVRQSRAAEMSVVLRQDGRATNDASSGLGAESHADAPPRTGSLGTAIDAPVPLAVAASLPRRVRSLRYLSQLDLSYLVCEGDRELVLIDQHIAHELVELARLKRRAMEIGDADRVVATQPLLFPMTLDLRADLATLACDRTSDLARLGFEVSASGPTTLALAGVPSGIRDEELAPLLTAILERWGSRRATTEAERLEDALAIVACRMALRVGDRVTPGEAEALLGAMEQIECSDPGLHRRPPVVRWSLAEIARRFGGSE